MRLQRVHGRVVGDPQWRQEPGQELSTTVLSLRVDVVEGGGAGVRSYDVEMRGTRIYGFVRAGDEVEVFSKRGGELLTARAIHNVKTHGWVTADSGEPPEKEQAPVPDLGTTAIVVGEPEFRTETGRMGTKTLLALRAAWRGAVRDVELRPPLLESGINGTVQRGDAVTIEGKWRHNVLRAKRIHMKATGAIVESNRQMRFGA